MYVKFAGILLDELEIYGNFGGSTQIVWELWWINSQIYEKFGGFTAHLWDIWWINSNLWQLDEKYDDAWWFQWDLVGLNGKKALNEMGTKSTINGNFMRINQQK